MLIGLEPSRRSRSTTFFAKVRVVGSNPVVRSERLLRTRTAACSSGVYCAGKRDPTWDSVTGRVAQVPVRS